MTAPLGCMRRLMKEYQEIQKDPPPFIVARPEEDNILLWYFVLEGPPDSPYEGGIYLGKLRFPETYPFAPPSIMMCTPSGRFKTETRLCLSMSDFHPKEWNPQWGPRSLINGILSFMMEETQTYGSMSTSPEAKKQFARESHGFNCKHPVFGRLFPEKLEKCERRLREIRREDEEEKRKVAEARAANSTPFMFSSITAAARPYASKTTVLRGLQILMVVLVAMVSWYLYLHFTGSSGRSVRPRVPH